MHLFTAIFIQVYVYICFCVFFVLIGLIVASELPDADAEGGSDGDDDFGMLS